MHEVQLDTETQRKRKRNQITVDLTADPAGQTSTYCIEADGESGAPERVMTASSGRKDVEIIDLTASINPVTGGSSKRRIRLRRARGRLRTQPHPINVEDDALAEGEGKPGGHSIKCPICLENLSGRASYSTTCGHIYCEECISGLVGCTKTCAVCRRPIARKNSVHRIYLS